MHGNSTIPHLDADRLASLLTPQAALEAMQSFFASHSREDVRAPRRIHLNVPGRNTVGLYMPSATSRYIGVKMVHLMPRRYPAVEAEIFLYDAESGRLLFWGDGKPMTGLRTAAVSTAASLRLCPDFRSLLIFGGGVQAAAHITAMASAYPRLGELRAVTRSEESFARLRELLPAQIMRRVRRGGDVPAELARADCIVTTTAAPEPLFDWQAVRPGTHIVAVGSVTPEMNELPPQAFLDSRVYIDTPAALGESGDFAAAKRIGWSEASVAGDLFDLLASDDPPPPQSTTTLFKSVGEATQDLALLIHLWESIRAEG